MLLGQRKRERRQKFLERGGVERRRRSKSVGAGSDSRKEEEAGRKRGELVSEAAQPTCGFAL